MFIKRYAFKVVCFFSGLISFTNSKSYDFAVKSALVN